MAIGEPSASGELGFLLVETVEVDLQEDAPSCTVELFM